jgi:hypothetical protein
MTEGPPTDEDATAVPDGSRQPVVDGDGIPRWFVEQTPRARLGRRLAILYRPLAGVAVAALAAALWLTGRQAEAISCIGVVALVVGFSTGVAVLRRLLSGSHPVIGVARAMVEEAIGTRVSVLLVMLVVVTLPVLPLLLDPAERLAYRLQFFLAWAISGASVLLTVMSIALGCSSVCGDIDSRRIHMALSKPLRRWEYLLGKWLGVVLLDLLLVALVGVAVYGFAQALARTTAHDAADRMAVDEQVLTARAVVRPSHPAGVEFERSVAATIDEIRQADPGTFDKDPRWARKRILAQRVHEWHTVSADVVSSFLFSGLDPARIRSPVVQLRLEPFADNSTISRADVRFSLWLNERPFPVLDGRHQEYTLASGMVHTIDLPTSAIAPDGVLRVSIANRNLVMPGEEQPTSISFTPGSGLEVLYRVGGFGGNCVRGLLVVWAKLAMLTAASLAAAAWLGFPTAILTSLMIYVSAAANAFFADAIDIYTGLDRRDATLVAMLRLRFGMLVERVQGLEWWEVIKTLGSYAADGFLSLIPSFGDYDSVTQLATGRVVPLAEAASGLAVLGVVYPLALLALGWVLLERRDLVSTST